MNSKPNNLNQREDASFAHTNIPLVPMDLEERKAVRREMLYQAIRQTMTSLEVVSSRYKFKVINLDARHHRFLALIEVTATFKARKGSRPQTFPQIEAFLKENAFEHFGVVLERVFWRVSESEREFERRLRAGDSGTVATSPHVNSQQAQANAHTGLARQEYSDVSHEERLAYVNALKKGEPLPSVTVGGRPYETENQPLDRHHRSGIDGTQYGLLE